MNPQLCVMCCFMSGVSVNGRNTYLQRPQANFLLSTGTVYHRSECVYTCYCNVQELHIESNLQWRKKVGRGSGNFISHITIHPWILKTSVKVISSQYCHILPSNPRVWAGEKHCFYLYIYVYVWALYGQICVSTLYCPRLGTLFVLLSSQSHIIT